MELKGIEKEVVEWHQQTFPKANINAIFYKFSEEMEEFEEEYVMTRPDVFEDKAAEEFTDMCIVFISARAKLNLSSLSQLIAEKLKINKERTWGKETKNGDRPRIK